MLHILSVTFPFFALVLCGYLAAQRGVLPLAAIPGLNSFVLFFALPCMLYRFGSTTPIHELLDVRLGLLYGACAVLMVGAVMVWTRFGPTRRRMDWNNTAMGALVGAFPNTGFMGVPLLVALVGSKAAAPVIVTILVDMVFTSSLCIALSRLDARRAAGATGAWQALNNALKGVATNPMPWAIVLGAVSSAMQWTWPAPVTTTVGLLADAASPVALFSIGAVLARSRLQARPAHEGPLHWLDYAPIAIMKLVLHPALVLGLGTLAIWWGWGVSAYSLQVLVLLAALPSASNVSLLAERYGADNGRIARIILVSTTAAFVSFTAVVALMAVTP